MKKIYLLSGDGYKESLHLDTFFESEKEMFDYLPIYLKETYSCCMTENPVYKIIDTNYSSCNSYGEVSLEYFLNDNDKKDFEKDRDPIYLEKKTIYFNIITKK